LGKQCFLWGEVIENSDGARNFVEPGQYILPNIFRIYIKQF